MLAGGDVHVMYGCVLQSNFYGIRYMYVNICKQVTLRLYTQGYLFPIMEHTVRLCFYVRAHLYQIPSYGRDIPTEERCDHGSKAAQDLESILILFLFRLNDKKRTRITMRRWHHLESQCRHNNSSTTGVLLNVWRFLFVPFEGRFLFIN